MNKLTVMGLLAWLVSAVIVGFQALSSLMGREDGWNNLCIGDLFDAKYLGWIDGISWIYIQKSADYIVTMPLFLLLIFIGIIFFLINAFSRV
ncbi:MAG TPA: hypothetical protein ENG35_07775 [Desulfobacteraceae bacterium]|nr:hypothetical protein [Desulfobacteraceae bacterium]